MAVAALIIVYRHWVIGGMTAHTERIVKDMAKTGTRVVDMEMNGRRRLVKVAVQAVDISVIGVVDDHLHRGAGGCRRVDVAAGVVAGDATTKMGGQDIGPVLYRVAVGAKLRVGLRPIGNRVEHDGVVNRSAGGAMVMAGEVGRMAADTFATANNSRSDEGAVGGRVVAGAATLSGMCLTNTDEG